MPCSLIPHHLLVLFSSRGYPRSFFPSCSNLSILELADDQVRQSLAQIFDDSSLANLRPSELILTELQRPPQTGEQPLQQTRERYVLLGKPKLGGIGQVWRAKDTELGREIALKE